MKTTIQLKGVLFFVIACMLTSIANAQAPAASKPIPSPRDSVSGTVAGSTIIINYGSPSVKGRKIWGGLEPYGKVWRAGANEATTFTTTKDIMVEGKKLPAGIYGFFLIPTEGKWTVIFNSVAKQWGAFNYKQDKDVLRVTVTPVKSALQERLIYTINDKGFALVWENVTIPVSIK